MHKLIEYVCDELEELERKVDKGGKLSMSETEYMDTLAHAKKNLLKGEEMYGEEEMYSMGGSYGDGVSMRTRRDGGRDRRYSREDGRHRDSMGRYSRRGYSKADHAELVEELRDIMDHADVTMKKEFEHFIDKIEQM